LHSGSVLMKKTVMILSLVLFVVLIVIACAPQQQTVPINTAPEVPLQEKNLTPEAVPQQNNTMEKKPASSSQAEQVEKKITVEQFVVEGDDKGFYPNQIAVKKGNTVRITFKARLQGTYYGGLEFKSSAWGTTGTVKPGEKKTIEFVAENDFEFKSYWPSTGVLKATGKAVVG